jgi:hypothetical protein
VNISETESECNTVINTMIAADHWMKMKYATDVSVKPTEKNAPTFDIYAASRSNNEINYL